MTISAAQTRPQTRTRVEPVYVFGTRVNDPMTEFTAAVAARFHGARPGTWNGRNGNAYALPCRNSEGMRFAPAAQLGYVDEFLKYARANPNLQFRVARFGCEPQGYRDSEIAPLFRNAPVNCVLPAVWQRALGRLELARVLVFDPLARLGAAEWRTVLARYLALNLPLWGVKGCELLSIGGPRDATATATVARELGYRHRVITADADYYGAQTDLASEMHAIWHATHLVSITDPDQTAVPSHVRIYTFATRDGLMVDDLNVDDTLAPD